MNSYPRVWYRIENMSARIERERRFKVSINLFPFPFPSTLVFSVHGHHKWPTSTKQRLNRVSLLQNTNAKQNKNTDKKIGTKELTRSSRDNVSARHRWNTMQTREYASTSNMKWSQKQTHEAEILTYNISVNVSNIAKMTINRNIKYTKGRPVGSWTAAIWLSSRFSRIKYRWVEC